MRPPPPLGRIPRYPITAGLGIIAIAVTLIWSTTGREIHFLLPTALQPQSLPWRLVTSIFPHVGIFHLMFNVYWLWVFGSLLEGVFGHFRFALMVLVLALGSGAAEWAVLNGGVGLSGVGYGLFGMLWVLSRRDRRFAGAVDPQTIATFIGWFFFCIVLTVTHVMPVANVAHAVGAGLGLLMGWLIVGRKWERVAACACVAAALGIAGLAAGPLRPAVNFSEEAPAEFAVAADAAFKENRDADALAYLKEAIRYRGATAGDWYNIGVAEIRLGRSREALARIERAVAMDPNDQQFSDALKELRAEFAVGSRP